MPSAPTHNIRGRDVYVITNTHLLGYPPTPTKLEYVPAKDRLSIDSFREIDRNT